MLVNQMGDDLLKLEVDYVRAETGKRFLNYLIDWVSFIVLAVVIVVALTVLSPSLMEGYFDDSVSSNLMDRLITMITYALYMSVMEGLTKGKSLGKLITGTRAVNLDGSAISFGTAFKRGFSRAVPFCAFSAFGTPPNPWQDKWTDTMVIDERKTRQN